MSKNNGGNTSYYDIIKGAKTLDDIIESKNMSFAIGNIFKAAYRLGQKDNVTEAYDLNKIIYYAERRLKQLNKETGV